jgi:hypothetical protein
MIRLINFSGEKFMKRSCAALKKPSLQLGVNGEGNGEGKGIQRLKIDYEQLTLILFETDQYP